MVNLMRRMMNDFSASFGMAVGVALILAFWQVGCEDSEESAVDAGASEREMTDTASSPEGDADADAEGDTDADTDGDTDADTDADTDTNEDPGPMTENEWVPIGGGTFMMGSPEGIGNDNERPQHPVDVAPFEMLRTEVITEHYARCVADGGCSPNGPETFCNHAEDSPGHPVTCVDWYQAAAFCEWLGGRLPTEAEWEYAARSGGQDILYPWGDEAATCDLAVTDGESGTDRGCGLGTTWPVCSKPLGNSAQGLCDLAGNVYEWVEDWYHRSYEIEVEDEVYAAPDDGGAWLEPVTSDAKLMRGNGISSDDDFRAAFRQHHEPEFYYGGLGIRCVREPGNREED